MPDGAAAYAARVVDGVGLSSSAPQGGSRSCCAAAAEPVSGTIRRSDASPRRPWRPFRRRLSCSRRRGSARSSAESTSARIACERRCATCLARSRRRWPPGRQGLTAPRRSRVCRTWSAAARSGVSASAGRPRRRRARSLRRWIGLRRGRATFGSSGNGRASADRPSSCSALVDRQRPGGPGASARVPRNPQRTPRLARSLCFWWGARRCEMLGVADSTRSMSSRYSAAVKVIPGASAASSRLAGAGRQCAVGSAM
jgi:hypothetical protein